MAFWIALLVKAVSSALIVVIASVAAEAAGPFWGGLIITLPIGAGPAYVMLALQHDSGFIAASALGSFAANAATFVLLTAFALLAPRHRRSVVIGGGLAAWLLTVLAIRAIGFGLGGAALLNLVMIALAHGLTRRAARAPAVPRGTLRRRWFELPVRAALVGSVVAGVVTASRVLGPGVTGAASVFPVAFTSFAFLVLPRLGGAAAAAVMAGAVRAMPGFVLALLALHLCAGTFGAWVGLLAMLGTSLVWSGGMLVVRARRERAAALSGPGVGRGTAIPVRRVAGL
jgi:uncharacterized membrane protein (GlpM family)